jgi:hypothetical protein
MIAPGQVLAALRAIYPGQAARRHCIAPCRLAAIGMDGVFGIIGMDCHGVDPNQSGNPITMVKSFAHLVDLGIRAG